MQEMRKQVPAGKPCEVAQGSYGRRLHETGKESTRLQEACPRPYKRRARLVPVKCCSCWIDNLFPSDVVVTSEVLG
jgi:hypothetical protein